MNEGTEQPGLPDMQKGKDVRCARKIVTVFTLLGSSLQGEHREEQEHRGLLPVYELELQPNPEETKLLQQRAENKLTACHLSLHF